MTRHLRGQRPALVPRAWGDPKTCKAPDVMVAFGRPKGDRYSYLNMLRMEAAEAQAEEERIKTKAAERQIAEERMIAERQIAEERSKAEAAEKKAEVLLKEKALLMEKLKSMGIDPSALA